MGKIRRLKITFVLNGIGLSGGVKNVFEFANCLVDRGHDVAVIFPMWPLAGGTAWYDPKVFPRKGFELLKNLLIGSSIKWFNLRSRLLMVPTLAEKHIPQADIIVATWWETAYYVNSYGKDKGEKFYLVQHYEVWGGPEDLVNESYKLGVRNIVHSNWLKEILESKLGAKVVALIPHAPNLEDFYPEASNGSSEKIRVLMPHRLEKWKGVEDGIKAFEIARAKHPELQLVMFGLKRDENIPDYAEFHLAPFGEVLRRLYNSCHIFLFPSKCEGFGMPPIEAMACKCAVVTTRVGAVPDYTIEGETALVYPPKSPELLAEGIVRLVEDEALRKRISEAGYNHIIKNYNWARSTEMLEEVFVKALGEKNTL